MTPEALGMPTHRRILLWVLAIAAATLAYLLLTAAHAQAGTGSIPDPRLWFGSASIWGGVVMALVAFLRANLLPNIKGGAVLALAFGISVGGAIIVNTGALARLGLVLDGNFLDALAFGVAAGGIAAGLWDTGTGLARAAGKALATASITAPLALAAPTITNRATIQPAPLLQPAPANAPVAPNLNPQALTDYLLDLIRARFGATVPPFAFAVLETLAREFAGQLLTEDVRAAIQRRLLDLLAAAGAPGSDL